MKLTTTRRRIVLGSVGVLLVGGLATIPTVANAATACQVTYTKAWDNGSGFGANITIQNLGDPLTSWTLTFSYSGSQRVTQGWSATWSPPRLQARS